MSVCINETDLLRAVRKFLNAAEIPSMGYNMDNYVVRERVIPAFLKSLYEIADIQLCYGFDIEQVKRDYMEGNDLK
jgi:hypothetical protein